MDTRLPRCKRDAHDFVNGLCRHCLRAAYTADIERSYDARHLLGDLIILGHLRDAALIIAHEQADAIRRGSFLQEEIDMLRSELAKN